MRKVESLLLTAEQMRIADERALKRLGDDFSLMQKAGEAVYKEIKSRGEAKSPLILVGPGNNGGDGLVVARLMHQDGLTPAVLMPKGDKGYEGEAAKALSRLPKAVKTYGSADEVDWASHDLILDALFGTGLSRKIGEPFQTIIQAANQARAFRVAIDISSGVDATSGALWGPPFQAHLTITMAAPKRGHFLLPGRMFTGNLAVADIGIIMEDLPGGVEKVRLANMQPISPDAMPNVSQVHKYQKGHAMIVGGPMARTGAAKLAADAALRAGAGLSTILCPAAALPAYAAWATSVMTRPFKGLGEFKAEIQDEKVHAIAIGMALGRETVNKEEVLAVLETKKRAVIDADGISLFADNPDELFSALHENVVLTPHDGEFARLFPTIKADRLTSSLAAAKLAGCVVVLKGPDTCSASPDGYAYVNHNAGPELATAGAGDVLSGIIVAHLASNDRPILDAAAYAVWRHGYAGRKAGEGLIADDIAKNLPPTELKTS